MDIQTAITQRRSIRRFQPIPIEKEVISKLVDLSRLYASGANLQPIRYIVVNSQPLLDKIFDNLRWAAYLPGFEIQYDQRPMAYVVLTCTPQAKKNSQFDVGAAATTLMLAAEGEGLATCCLASFGTKELKQILELDEMTEPALVIALGYPAQKSRAVDLSDDVRYYEDADSSLCVPKRKLEDVLTLK